MKNISTSTAQTVITHFYSDPADFVADVAKAVFAELRPIVEELFQTTDEAPKTRKQAAQYLHVSLTTFNDYEKRGLVKGYRIGTRRLYKVEDLKGALTTVRRSVNHG